MESEKNKGLLFGEGVAGFQGHKESTCQSSCKCLNWDSSTQPQPSRWLRNKLTLCRKMYYL